MMPTYNLGIMTVVGHDADKITDALGIPEQRFDDLLSTAREAWGYGDTVSESIEFIAQRLNGSELVLAMVLLGRFWEESKQQES
ncbi:MAG: hypothetical protein ACTSYL_01965 [Candidatus Thorarchaeota archaeon]